MFLIWGSIKPCDAINCDKSFLKNITATGQARLGSGLSVDDAKSLAILDAKRNAIEKVGTYIESFTIIKNNMLKQDSIKSFTAGLIETTVLEVNKQIDNNEFIISVKIKGTIDCDVLTNRINLLEKDYELRRQYEQLNNHYLSLLDKIDFMNPDSNSSLIATQLNAYDWYNKGIIVKDPKIKIGYYTISILLDSTLSYSFTNRGVAYSEIDMWEEAVDDWMKAVQLDDKNVSCRKNLWYAFSMIGKYNEALIFISEAISIDSTYELLYLDRAYNYMQLEMKNKALNDLEKYLELGGGVKHGNTEEIKKRIEELKIEIKE